MASTALAPAAPAPADRVFSPLSCRRALPGNVKKRLLMPSRGKARPSARACVCCAHACAADGSGHVQGQSTRAGPHPAAPAPPDSPVTLQRPERCSSGPQLAHTLPPALGPPARGPPLLPGPAPVSGLSSLRQPWCPRRPPVLTVRMPPASACVAACAVLATLPAPLPRWGAVGPWSPRGADGTELWRGRHGWVGVGEARVDAQVRAPQGGAPRAEGPRAEAAAPSPERGGMLAGCALGQPSGGPSCRRASLECGSSHLPRAQLLPPQLGVGCPWAGAALGGCSHGGSGGRVRPGCPRAPQGSACGRTTVGGR